MGLHVSFVGGEGKVDWGMIQPGWGWSEESEVVALLKGYYALLQFGAEVQFALWFFGSHFILPINKWVFPQ